MITSTQRPVDLADALLVHSARLVRMVSGQAQTGMSATQARTLARLADHGPLRVTELAAAEHVTQPTMSALVDRLEQAGYARRQHDHDDGRVVLVAVTEEGERTRAAALQAMAAVLAPRLAALTESERADLHRYIEILQTLMESPNN